MDLFTLTDFHENHTVGTEFCDAFLPEDFVLDALAEPGNCHVQAKQLERLFSFDRLPRTLKKMDMEGKQVVPAKKICKKRKTPKPLVIPPEDHAVYTNRTNWSHKEEVFLIGAVLERFFRVGSLSSKPNSQPKSKDSNECWDDIKDIYDVAWRNHSIITNIPAPYERSANALARHYKVMKSNLNKPGYEGKSLREYWDEFHQVYNFQNNLLEEPPSKRVKSDFAGL